MSNNPESLTLRSGVVTQQFPRGSMYLMIRYLMVSGSWLIVSIVQVLGMYTVIG